MNKIDQMEADVHTLYAEAMAHTPNRLMTCETGTRALQTIRALRATLAIADQEPSMFDRKTRQPLSHDEQIQHLSPYIHDHINAISSAHRDDFSFTTDDLEAIIDNSNALREDCRRLLTLLRSRKGVTL
jgi:hypothetical protein